MSDNNDPLLVLGEVPGAMIMDPVVFDPAVPNLGGKLLGVVELAQYVRFEVRLHHTAEEFGARVMGEGYYGERLSLAFGLRSLDDDALGAIYPNWVIGDVTQKGGLEYPGAVTEGTLMEEDRQHSLVFYPLAIDDHPCVWLPRALPRPDPGIPKTLNLGGRLVYTSTWWGIEGDNGKAYEVKRLFDLTPP